MLTANVGIGSQVVQNDFDSMPIYKDIHDVTDSFGNVFVRIPKFYIRKEVTPSKYSPMISEDKLPGFYLPHCFWDFENNKELPYCDIAKYEGSLSADGTKLESKTGATVHVNENIVNFRNLARANGKGYGIMDIHMVDVIQTLFRVEFATMHSQSIHPGATSGNSEPLLTGTTDGVAASSGAMGTAGTFAFNYRGIENPWGDVYEFIDGLNINDRQAWVCKDMEEYASNVFANPYEKIGYINHDTNDYVTEMGYDPLFPFIELPVKGGGGTSTYYADYYYQNTGQRVAYFGGRWSFGSAAGLSLWLLNFSSGAADAGIGARLLRKPLP